MPTIGKSANFNINAQTRLAGLAQSVCLHTAMRGSCISFTTDPRAPSAARPSTTTQAARSRTSRRSCSDAIDSSRLRPVPPENAVLRMGLNRARKSSFTTRCAPCPGHFGDRADPRIHCATRGRRRARRDRHAQNCPDRPGGRELRTPRRRAITLTATATVPSGERPEGRVLPRQRSDSFGYVGSLQPRSGRR